MTDLLDLIAEVEDTAKRSYPIEDPGQCEFCGEKLTGYAWDSTNHGRIEDTCVTRWLTRNHVRHAEWLLDPANRQKQYGLWRKCGNHPGKGKKPCPQECFEAEYEHYAARATQTWHSDEWKATS